MSANYRALMALCVGFFIILIDQTIVAVATPHLIADFDASLTAVVWVTSVYLLCFAVPLLFTGRLGDRYGQRNIYRIGMAVFIVASVVCGCATSVAMLIAGRALQGLGAAILTPQTMSVINRIFPRESRGAALGVWGAVAGLAALVGPVIGGVIVATVGWHWIFFINVPLGLLSLAMVTAWVPKMPRTARAIDPVSVAVSLVGLFAFTFGLQQGEDFGWAWWIWALFGVGLGAFVLFVWLQATAQARGTEALVPLKLFAHRNFSLGAASISTMGFTVSSQMLPIMIYLQTAKGLDAQQAGLLMVPMAVASGVLSPFVGRASDKVAPRALSVSGFGAMALGLAVLGIGMLRGAGLVEFCLGVVIMGVGSALVWAPNSATAMRDVPVELMGAASGVYNTTRQLGSVTGAAAIGVTMQMASERFSVGPAMGITMFVPAFMLVIGMILVSFFRGGAPVAQ